MQQRRQHEHGTLRRRSLILAGCALSALPRSGAAHAPPLIEHMLPLPGAGAGAGDTRAASRALWLWLPPGYALTPQRRHPLLLLLDGQNVFSTAAAGSPVRWGMETAAQALLPELPAGAAAPIIAAVAHGGAQRIDEYTPWPTQRQGHWLGGSGVAHAQWLVQRVLPFIHERWRTQGPQQTTVGGSSLAALMALWLLVHQRQAVASALAVSPAVWWAGRRILQELPQAPQPPQRLWIDIGTGEGEQAVGDARALRQAVAGLGWPHRYTEDAGAAHNESAWAGRAPAMLRYLYASA